jgi:2-polyprenyl-3-methyl-5-hydroxy-6-metoxy-1,4-benzoquinol methylase
MDIGCGSGLFLGLLQYYGFGIRGFGIDASHFAIDCANAMARRNGGGHLHFEHVRKDDPWPEGQFDVFSIIFLSSIRKAHFEPLSDGYLREACCCIRI